MANQGDVNYGVRGKSESCFRYKHKECKVSGCTCPCHAGHSGLKTKGRSKS